MFASYLLRARVALLMGTVLTNFTPNTGSNVSESNTASGVPRGAGRAIMVCSPTGSGGRTGFCATSRGPAARRHVSSPRDIVIAALGVKIALGLTGQQRDAFGVMGQWEGVEDLDLLDGVTLTAVEPDIAGERCGLATDVHHTRNPGRGQ